MPPIVNKQKPNQPNSIPTRPSSVIDRIGPISFDETDGIKMLVYGASGSGKTTFAATFPAPLLWIICSGSKKPGELRSINTPEHRKRIQQVVIQESQEIREVYEHVNETGKYNTVVLDHASGLQDLILKELLGLEELPVQKTWGMASQQQYGTCAMKCKEMFRALLSLKGHVLMIAQERDFRGAEGDGEALAPTVGAALMPSLTGWLAPACDYVCQTMKKPRMVKSVTKLADGKEIVMEQRGKGVEYCLRTGPHEIYQTKFRMPKGSPLPEYVVDPSWTKIEALIKGKQ